MSFRARLTTFFVLIVVIPMAAVGFLVFRLIGDSQAAKTDARTAGIAATAASAYESASTQASLDARTVARDLGRIPVARLRGRALALARQAGIARIVVTVDGRTISVGNPRAIAPGIAVIRATATHPRRTVEISELTPAQYGRELTSTGVAVVVRAAGRTLGATLPAAARRTLPASRGTVAIGHSRYRVITQRFSGFGDDHVEVSVLSDVAATTGSAGDDRLLAGIFLGAFLVLAVFFGLLASRALEGQLAGFLDAARRLGGGDFSAPIETTGHDEFAALGEEFNSMSRQLQNRLDELERERARVRASIRRIGEAFASGLDREALLQLALRTAMDATEAGRGRVLARRSSDEPLVQAAQLGPVSGVEGPLADAEHEALGDGGIGEASSAGVHVASVRLGEMVPGGPTHGLITVSRDERPFTEDDLELLRSLAGRATLALANVIMHDDVQRQAITDDLTGLVSHGHFQELLDAEMDGVRRYRYPVGLIMIDIDHFKSFNDTYGHQQGDVVLRWVANALRETSRDVDIAARYGGEEMVLILPHTDLAGTYEMAERVRLAIAAMEVPRLDGEGTLQVTASVGAAASRDGHRNDLIAAADGALYVAKRTGRNRTVRADPGSASGLADVPDMVVGE
jgi:diguanylate cyclase (GGDEF)-like protein